MIDPRLNLLHQALTRKANGVQRQFGALGDTLQEIGRQLVKTRRGETGPLREEQAALREKQLALAAEINVWRERARAVLRQRDEASLEAFMTELEADGDENVSAAVAAVRAGQVLAAAHPEQAQAALDRQSQAAPTSRAGRLLERARIESGLRDDDAAARQREAVEYANAPGQAQNDQALVELEGGLADPDPVVRDMAALTLIQTHRFRALRLAELDAAHVSVRWLTRLKHPAVVPVLIEIMETPRTGYVPGESGLIEGNNRRSRLVALASLVEWRTPAAQTAIRTRLHDTQMAEAAERALALFPGYWV